MASIAPNGNRDLGQEHLPITRITVGGFKSIRDEQSIDLAPLTILAGANSSGKSSMMQAVLLLKQTLESPHDPGPWLLPGSHVRFGNAPELLARTAPQCVIEQFRVGIQVGQRLGATSEFEYREQLGLFTTKTDIEDGADRYGLRREMSHEEIRKQMPPRLRDPKEAFARMESDDGNLRWTVPAARCFLEPWIEYRAKGSFHGMTPLLLPPVLAVRDSVLRIVHLPGIRQNPGQGYPRTGVDLDYYLGTFDPYVASIIEHWQRQDDSPVLAKVKKDLQLLTLTSDVRADRIGDAELRLLVGRVSQSPSEEPDLVPMAHTGLGTSHALPVVVALHAATESNLVYLEQPELHLHPKAQVAMAGVLMRAIKRGVRMLIETHSALLLLAIQALVAEGKLPPEDVILHWFTRSKKDGTTEITSGSLNRAGAYGDWPEDFGDVALNLDKAYLDAADKVLLGKR